MEPSATDTRGQLHRPVGTIVTQEWGGKDCRHLQFDNITGTVSGGALGRCPDTAAAGTDWTKSRMDAIRVTFSKR